MKAGLTALLSLCVEAGSWSSMDHSHQWKAKHMASTRQVLPNIFSKLLNYDCCIVFMEIKEFIFKSLFHNAFAGNRNRNLKSYCSCNKKKVWDNSFLGQKMFCEKKIWVNCTILYAQMRNPDQADLNKLYIFNQTFAFWKVEDDTKIKKVNCDEICGDCRFVKKLCL